MRKDFNYLCHVNVEQWHKMWIYFCSSEKFSIQNVWILRMISQYWFRIQIIMAWCCLVTCHHYFILIQCWAYWVLAYWVLDKHFLQWIPYDPLWSQSSVCIKLLKCALWPESNMNQYIIQCTKAIYWVLITFNKLQSHTHPTWCLIVTAVFKVVTYPTIFQCCCKHTEHFKHLTHCAIWCIWSGSLLPVPILTYFSINPLHAKFFRGNINIYLHFMSLLHIDLTQVLKTLPRIREGPTYSL